MSIHIGTNKATKLRIGANKVLFATLSDSTLIYPDTALISYGGAEEAATYAESGDCTQWALNSGRNLVDMNAAAANTLYATNSARFKAVGYTGSGAISGIFRYRTDIRNAHNYTASIAIGIAIFTGTVFTYLNGSIVSINYNWQTFDISFGTTLYAGQIYAPVLKVGSTSIYERYACATFTAD